MDANYNGLGQQHSTDSDLVESAQVPLADMAPIGSETLLPSGSVLQTPNPAVIERLQAEDPRVRYFPADMAIAQSAGAQRYEFHRAVVDLLGAQVRRDFGDEPVAVRGTVASLTRSFPFFDETPPFSEPTDAAKEDLHSVEAILRTGSDSGKDITRVGFLDPDTGELNYQTAEWLAERHNFVDLGLLIEGREQERSLVFPVLVVYRLDAFENGAPTHGWNTLTGSPEERVAAIYVTDKVVRPASGA